MATKRYLYVDNYIEGHLLALSSDGTLAGSGPTQEDPTFRTDLAGSDFVANKDYWVIDTDPLTPSSVPVIRRVRFDDDATAGTGAAGKDGKDGKDGSQILTGPVDPSLLGGTSGKLKDVYINTVTGDFFQRLDDLPNNHAGTWFLLFNVRGPRGLQGPVGPPGPAGTGGTGGTGSSVTFMPVPNSGSGSTYFQTFPVPAMDDQNDVVTWQTIYDVARNLVLVFNSLQANIDQKVAKDGTKVLSDVNFTAALRDQINTLASSKVDKIVGYGLSQVNFTQALYDKLVSMTNGSTGGPGTGTNGGTAAFEYLRNYPIPADADKDQFATFGEISAIVQEVSNAVDYLLSYAGTGMGGGNGNVLTVSNFFVGGAKYAPILFLPQTSEGTYDHSILEVGLSAWESNVKKVLRISCSNRNVFRANVVCYGDNDNPNCHLVAYQQQNATVLYIMAGAGFNELSVTYLKLVQTTGANPLVFSDAVPTGSVVYDSRLTLPDLSISADGIATRSLPVTASPLNLLSRNIYTGDFEAVILTDVVKTIRQVESTTPVVLPVLLSGTHYQLVDTPAPVAPNYIATTDANTCERITGWVVDTNHPHAPQSVDIYDNGVLVKTVTATLKRGDVAQLYGGDGTVDLYGFEYYFDQTNYTGSARIRNVVVHNSSVGAGLSGTASYTTPVCGTAPVYQVQVVLRGAGVILEGNTGRVKLVSRYSNNTEAPYSGPAPTWSLINPPAGINYTLTPVGLELDFTNVSVDATKTVVLRATFSQGGYAEDNIQLVDSVCQRPAGLRRQQLVVNYVQGGSAHLFTSLDDANRTIGRIFNETNVGISDFTKVNAEMADFNIGTTVYFNWGDTDTSCSTVSNGIYAMLSSNGADTVKLAVYVVNGKIADVKASDYTTPPPANPYPVKLTVQRLGNVNDTAAGGSYEVEIKWTSLNPSLNVRDAITHYEECGLVKSLDDNLGYGQEYWREVSGPIEYYTVGWGNQSINAKGVNRWRLKGTTEVLLEYVIIDGRELRPRYDPDAQVIYQTPT